MLAKFSILLFPCLLAAQYVPPGGQSAIPYGPVTFTASTTPQTITAATHGFTSQAIAVNCLESGSNKIASVPSSVDPSTFAVTIAPLASFTGSCWLIGTGSVSNSAVVEDQRSETTTKTTGVSVAASATQSLLNVTAGNAGTISLIQLDMDVTASTVAQRLAVVNDSKINVYCDQASAPGQSIAVGELFKLRGLPNPWTTDRDGVHIVASNGNVVSAYRKLEIPFTNGCNIDFVNGSGSFATTIYAQVYYKVGAPPVVNGMRRNKWKANWISNQTVAAGASVDLLPLVTGRGEIESVTLFVGTVSTNDLSYAYPPGPYFTIDGSQTSAAGGTEDYFGGQHVWNGGANQYRTNVWGVTMTSALQDQSTWGAYAATMWRNLYPVNRVTFNSSAKFTWTNGQSTGSVVIYALVTYWLDR